MSDAAARLAEYAHTPSCPRCGYDLRGDMQTWTTACALEGRCPECGLTFFWRDLLNPAFSAPWWLYDSADRSGRGAAAFLATVALTFLPWMLWKRVRMDHRTSPKRLALLTLHIALGVYVLYCMIYAGVVSIALSIRFNSGFALDYFESLEVVLRWPLEETRRATSTWCVCFGMTIFTPLAFFALPHSRRLGRVGVRHVARGAVYAFPIAALACGVVTSTHYLAWAMNWMTSGVYYGGQAAVGLFIAAWWWVFIRRYLRLSHPLWVLVAVISLAATATVTLRYVRIAFNF